MIATADKLDLTLDDQQHIVLEDMSWDFYERLIEEIGDRHIRVTYDEGRLEIMSPLLKHERFGSWIARLIELICLDREIAIVPAGSTTFSMPAKKKGLEPDECFYIKNVAAANKIEGKFNPKIHCPPDLAVEIDITSRSVAREPIYAALRVPELWRFDGERLHVLHLTNKGQYAERRRSLSFPFLNMSEFEQFVLCMRDLHQIQVLSEFRKWVAKLPRFK